MTVALLLAFLVVPLLEIYLVIQVGQLIGVVPTVVLLLLESLLGAWIVKREGRRAWTALRSGIGSGRMPSRELLDAALVLVGGTLLLTPGFATDIVGFFLVLPPTRPLARGLVTWFLARRVEAKLRQMTSQGGQGGQRGQSVRGHRAAPYGGSPERVVRGEVVEGGADDGGTAGR